MTNQQTVYEIGTASVDCPNPDCAFYNECRLRQGEVKYNPNPTVPDDGAAPCPIVNRIIDAFECISVVDATVGFYHGSEPDKAFTSVADWENICKACGHHYVDCACYTKQKHIQIRMFE